MHRWDWDLIYSDSDGSLTGTANAVVVFNNNFTTSKSNCVANNTEFANGAVCSNTNNWIRFAYNNLNLLHVLFTNVTNENNISVSIPLLKKRLTHPVGFMIALEAQQSYLFEYDQGLFPTNLSYSGAFYSLYPNDYVIIKHRLSRKPDRVLFGRALTTVESAGPLTSNSPSGSWYWHNDSLTLNYIVSNKQGRTPFLDVPVFFEAYKCRYFNCTPPISPGLKLPVTSRPIDALYWSNLTTWSVAEPGWGGYISDGVYELPRSGSSVKIPDGKYVVVDVPLPELKFLQIEGVLEFDDTLDNTLVAEIIFINGGQLIVGWENKPMERNVKIVLKGEKGSLNFMLPNGYETISGKAIGVYGGLDLHGKPRNPSWTKLNLTANAGTNKITLNEAVDWKIGYYN